MSVIVDRALSEFVDAWNAGRRPDALDYLQRVTSDAERDELATQIETFLDNAVSPDYDETVRAEIRSEPALRAVIGARADGGGIWPEVLPRLRARAGISIGDLAARLLECLQLDRANGERAVAYFERMERGELDPAGLSQRLLGGLDSLFGLTPGTLFEITRIGASLRPAPNGGGALLRADGDVDGNLVRDIATASRAALTPAGQAPDELDSLFLGGPDG